MPCVGSAKALGRWRKKATSENCDTLFSFFPMFFLFYRHKNQRILKFRESFAGVWPSKSTRTIFAIHSSIWVHRHCWNKIYINNHSSLNTYLRISHYFPFVSAPGPGSRIFLIQAILCDHVRKVRIEAHYVILSHIYMYILSSPQNFHPVFTYSYFRCIDVIIGCYLCTGRSRPTAIWSESRRTQWWWPAGPVERPRSIEILANNGAFGFPSRNNESTLLYCNVLQSSMNY